jgi:condensin complex subunit 3
VTNRIAADNQIFSETFSILSEVFDAESAESDMPPLAQMGLMIVDWLDPEKTV